MITVSQMAAQVIRQIISEKKFPLDTALRLGVTNEGCEGSGTKYRHSMEFDTGAPKPNDQVIESEGVKIFVDKESLRLLQGLQLDVRPTLGGVQFAFKNPNAKHSCGCSHTFSDEEQSNVGEKRSHHPDQRKYLGE